MTPIQLLEQLAVNPSYKRDFVSSEGDASILATRAENEISGLLEEQSKIWCALLPVDDHESTESDEPKRDSDDEADEEPRPDS